MVFSTKTGPIWKMKKPKHVPVWLKVRSLKAIYISNEKRRRRKHRTSYFTRRFSLINDERTSEHERRRKNRMRDRSTVNRSKQNKLVLLFFVIDERTGEKNWRHRRCVSMFYAIRKEQKEMKSTFIYLQWMYAIKKIWIEYWHAQDECEVDALETRTLRNQRGTDHLPLEAPVTMAGNQVNGSDYRWLGFDNERIGGAFNCVDGVTSTRVQRIEGYLLARRRKVISSAKVDFNDHLMNLWSCLQNGSIDSYALSIPPKFCSRRALDIAYSRPLSTPVVGVSPRKKEICTHPYYTCTDTESVDWREQPCRGLVHQ